MIKPYCFFFAAAGLFLIQSTCASETDDFWIETVQDADVRYRIKRNSGRYFDIDKQKKVGFGYDFEFLNKQAGSVEYGRVFVRIDSCKRGYGSVYFSNVGGDLIGKGEFVRFGETRSSVLGSSVCRSWETRSGTTSMKKGDGNWEVVATAEITGDKLALKKDTVRKIKYGGEQAVSVLYRFDSIKADTLSYGEYVISLEGCRRGSGVVYELDFDGKVTTKTGIVLNGQSMLSKAITALCAKI